MLEDLFQFIWKMKLFDMNNLTTTDGEPIEILQFGLQNKNSGPDFFNAKIKIGNTIWAGNVELHVKTSDWLLHHHQKDNSYQNIILHVVYINDVPLFKPNEEKFKTLVLKEHINEALINKYQNFKSINYKIPCEKSIGSVPQSFINSYLEKIIVDRLEEKSTHIESLLAENNYNWEQSFYIQLASNFGFKVNNLPFELVARNTPLMVLAKHKQHINQIEALLFGQAGLLNEPYQEQHPIMLQNEYNYLKKKYQLNGIASHTWKFSRLRPLNFPTIRLAQFAALIHESSHLFSKIISTENTKELMKLFNIKASTFWDNHYTFQTKSLPKKKALGKSAIENIIINTVVPFIFVYGKHYANEHKSDFALKLLAALKPEKNTIISLWNGFGIKAENAIQSQALIELMNKKCNFKKCLSCSIGHFIIKNN